MAERVARGAVTPSRPTRARSHERVEPSPAAKVRPTGPQCALMPAQLKSKIELGEPKKATTRLQTMKAGVSPRPDHKNKDVSKTPGSKTSGGAKTSRTVALALVLGARARCSLLAARCSLLTARCPMLDAGNFQPRLRLLHRGFEPVASNQNNLRYVLLDYTICH